MNILLFSTLYPNHAQPSHSLFVEQRLLHLIKDTGVSARVVAPVPWFPFQHERFGEYGVFARVPRQEVRNGLTIYHPRYLVLPKIGMTLAPFLIFLGVFFLARRLSRKGEGFDLIDAHFLYPDAIAALLLGKVLKKPVTVTCRGSDVNLHMKYSMPLIITRALLPWAGHIITVCQALKNELIKLRLDKAPITVLRNGVDTTIFHPVDRRQARKELGVEGEVWLSVGRLAELKGHHLTIEALSYRLGATLILVGDGPEKSRLQQLAQRLDVADRVIFAGSQPQTELKMYYSAADVMILASSREGWANVLLEAMACGAKVVASDVGGTAEVIGNSGAGLLFANRSAEELGKTVDKQLENGMKREMVASYARGFDWQGTSLGQYNIFSQLA